MNSVKAELFYMFYTAPIPLPLRDFRAFAYFCIRYFLKLGFLDGLPGYTFARGKWKYFANIRKKILFQ